MEGNLIIFAGAGASRGVAKDKYPTAVDFKQRLPEDVTGQYLFQQLDDYLREQVNGPVDIEHVLWELGRLIEAIDEFTSKDRFATRLLTKNQISSATGHQNPGHQTYAQFGQLGAVAHNLSNSINQNIYGFYSQEPTPVELEASWLPLLRWTAGVFARIDITTTNYDLVLEHALRQVPSLRVGTGEAPEVLPRIDLNRWDGDGPSDSGLLTKLHGSVHWKIGNGGTADRPVIRHGLPEFEGDHEKRLILYPGFKGRPDRQPFIAFHEYFKQRVSKATHILFIGFAFRDDFINELIATSIQPSTRVAVVDPTPALPIALSFLSRAKHLPQGFGFPMVPGAMSSEGIAPFNLNDVMEWAK
jgi:hypothetical protein